MLFAIITCTKKDSSQIVYSITYCAIFNLETHPILDFILSQKNCNTENTKIVLSFLNLTCLQNTIDNWSTIKILSLKHLLEPKNIFCLFYKGKSNMKKITLCIYFCVFSSITITNFAAINHSQTSPDAYASLDGNEEALISRMLGNPINFEINAHNETGELIVPPCYQQNRFCTIFQALHEKLHKEYIRPSLSHFQSIKEFIKRNPDGSFQKYIFFTGGDITQWTSHLMVAKQNQEGKFSAIRTIAINTPRDVNPLIDESDLWHPCGMDICGNYLAIPLQPYKIQQLNPGIYRGDRLRIVFFDISNPENPQRVVDPAHPARFYVLDLMDAAGGTITCPAIAFTRLINNRYIIACQYGYFVSRGQNIDSGFDFAGNINFTNTTGFAPKDVGEFQNLSFVTLSGQLYLIGTGTTSKLAPVILGENIANLYKLNLNVINAGQAFDIAPGNITAEFVAQISYGKECCISPDCDFSAASNITSQCSMLSMYNWVWNKNHIPCCFFGAI